ncbi:uncharacterized protein (DUF927 family)/phage/plasmid primase-like uncharacterized protein [Herbaspirillum sp. Sphag1AN]|uniref:DUF927 domain-containing protein n=1 Tax=unclassified Herbaspirillum TaxID=2624150 RepID=UPI0016078A78|nr:MULTISPECIES: DUF927 domain-containing protein [unclassified Herbaspirillum]MBB3211124.1 uncharacterized protein (DUF927 family)/phage/plasmid primase-like uncharacterized protein [Herbaspirillum sp. Sphag1AN]MBB3244753.1 uncharacterized protein (DUF927 family)/phage/plasmid primase-like uncharacterized protein [Herbaspirillum sp. Sphag64]
MIATLSSIEAQFGEAMAAYGLAPPEIVADGQRHRFDGPEDKRGKKSAWYVLYSDGVPAGAYGDWKLGISEKWSGRPDQTLTPTERAEYRAKIEKAKQVAEFDRLELEAAAAKACTEILAAARDATDDNPYCQSKGIKPYGLREFKDKRTLIVPIRDASGKVTSAQFIDQDGAKRFKSHGKIKGCYYSFGGKPVDTLLICEGFATGASLHAATGWPVAVSFNAGNLEAVALVLRGKLPDIKIIVCADNDQFNEGGNIGIEKATAAALAVGGYLAVPRFREKLQGQTDFNDLSQSEGLGIVKAQIEAAQMVQPDQVEVVRTELVRTEVRTESRPKTCRYGDGRFELSMSRGVFYVGTDSQGNSTTPQWICAPLEVIAKTRDTKSGAWGRLLVWHDDDGVRHQQSIPMEALQGDGMDMRRELASNGLAITTRRGTRDHLATYIQVWPVDARARSVERLGWHGPVYVMPSESIGQESEVVVFQNSHAIEPAFSTAGTLEAWRDTVGKLAAGNSRLVFALSVAFAGPLADIANEDSGGFHLRGGSSSGKTTALKVAASVWGSPSTYPRLWRSTANGLEGLAALHNDGLLILDELSQIDPKEAGESAYLLANGQGKARASRTGTARQSSRWRVLFLSAGEESLSALMARAGKKTNAGQEIRLADIEADAGAGMGAFEVLHDQPTPAALALAVKEAAILNHGTAGIAWLRAIVADRDALAEMMADSLKQFVSEAVPEDAASQVLRVAQRFALVAVAGELATHYGLTGWEQGEADRAAHKCFAAWLHAFGGTGNREERNVLSQVRAFFEAHGASRFEDIHATNDTRIINRAGFYRTGENGDREFLVLPEAFKRDVCSGFDVKAATVALLAAGWLQPGKDGKASQKPRIPILGSTTRCYVFTSKMWEGE